MVNTIANENNIDESGWQRKYLVLGKVLETMSSFEAEKFLDDTFMILNDELMDTYDVLVSSVATPEQHNNK